MSPTLSIILVGAFVAASCALVGSFLVLRKMALLGDAISHAVLPGIVIAFMMTSSRASLFMLLGAGVLGVITVFLVGVLKETRRLGDDASIGVVFPALFSIGVILISRYAGQIDLDLDCVLYGEIAYVPFDNVYWGTTSLGPEALWVTGGSFVCVLAFILIFYKELKLTSFDPGLAAAQGFSPRLMHYLLMTAVSITVVTAFESVGAILVVAMLIVPPATAFLLTRRLSTMLILAVGIGVFSSVAGYSFAREIDGSIAGAMATVAGGVFVLVLLFAPQGLLARAFQQRRLSTRLAGQLLMLHLGDSGAKSRDEIKRRFDWNDRDLVRAIESLPGAIERSGDGYILGSSGRAELEKLGIAPLRHQ